MKPGLLSLAIFILLLNPLMPADLPAGTGYAFHKQISLLATSPPPVPGSRYAPDLIKNLNCQEILVNWAGCRADLPERRPGGRKKMSRPESIGIDAKPDTAFARPVKYRPATPHLFIKKIHVYGNAFTFRENGAAAGLRNEAGIPQQQPSRIWMAADTPLSMPPQLFKTDRPDTKKYAAEYPFGTGFDLPLERIHATLSVGTDKRRINEQKEPTESFGNLKISWSPNFTAALNKIRQYLAGFRHGTSNAAPDRKIQPDLILAGIKVKY